MTTNHYIALIHMEPESDPAGDRALSGSRKDLILEQLDQLARLAVSPDNLVDTADIPAAPVENWIRARRGYPDP